MTIILRFYISNYLLNDNNKYSINLEPLCFSNDKYLTY